MEEIDEMPGQWLLTFESLRKKFIGMSVSAFNSNMKKRHENDWNMINMLREMGKIRTVKHKTKTYVILDPEYPVCGNCKHWNESGISCDNIPYSFPLDACRHLERFEPKELESEEIPELDF